MMKREMEIENEIEKKRENLIKTSTSLISSNLLSMLNCELNYYPITGNNQQKQKEQVQLHTKTQKQREYTMILINGDIYIERERERESEHAGVMIPSWTPVFIPKPPAGGN